jgi:signal transduction histidine kinase
MDTAAELEQILGQHRTEIRTWASLPALVDTFSERYEPRRLTTVLNRLVAAYPAYDLLLVVDRRHQILATNSRDRAGQPISASELVGNELLEGPWFTEADKQGYYVSGFRQSHLVAQVYRKRSDSLNLSAVIRDETGQPRGYLVGYVDWTYVQNVLDFTQATYATDLAGSLFLLELGANRFIAHHDANLYGEPAPFKVDWPRLVQQKPVGTVNVSWPERKTIGYALVRGTTAENTPWVVGVEAPDEVIYRQATVLRVLFIVLAGVATLIVIVLVYVISQRFTEPLLQLVHGAQAIAAGHMNVEMPVRRYDEVGALATTFNQMSAALRQRDEELRATNQQLAEANRLKSEFLANVSHELRTPMNSIIGFTTLVLQRAGHLLPELQRSNLQRVHKNALRLLGLLNSVLDLSKIESGSMDIEVERFSLTALLEQCNQVIAPLVEGRPVTLSLEGPPDDLVLQTDRQKVQQVVINLLGNAAKFTENGHIRTGFARVDHADPAGTGETSRGPWVRIWVEDTGIGVAPQDLERIFAEFRQVDGSPSRKYGGTGLGLSISRKLAKLLGGDILAESVLGKGSTFSLLIPVRHESAQSPRRDEQRPAPAGTTTPDEKGQAAAASSADGEPV